MAAWVAAMVGWVKAAATVAKVEVEKVAATAVAAATVEVAVAMVVAGAGVGRMVAAAGALDILRGCVVGVTGEAEMAVLPAAAMPGVATAVARTAGTLVVVAEVAVATAAG